MRRIGVRRQRSIVDVDALRLAALLALDDAEGDLLTFGQRIEAGAGERIGARIVDSLPIFVIGIVAALIVPSFRNNAELGMLVFIALVLAYLVYQVVLMTKYGQTFGKKLLGIRVVNADGDNPGFVKYVLVREFGYNLILSILGAIPLLGGIISIVALIANLVLLFMVERDRRVLWDLLADTYVVKV